MKRIALVVAFVVLVACAAAWQLGVRPGSDGVPMALTAAPIDLESEFDAIAVPPGVAAARRTMTIRSDSVRVGAAYSRPVEYQALRSHYDRELTSRGWRLVKEAPIRDWWQDLGGKSVLYCKQGNAAHLQYAGERASYGWTYALDLSRGLHRCPAWES